MATITTNSLPSNKSYANSRYSFIAMFEGKQSLVYQDNAKKPKGYATIGVGFMVSDGVPEILAGMAPDLKNKLGLSSPGYENLINAIRKATSNVLFDSDSSAQIAIQNAISQILNDAGNYSNGTIQKLASPFTFAYSSNAHIAENQMKVTFDLIIDGGHSYEHLIDKWLNGDPKNINKAIPDSRERLVLLSLAYNGLLGWKKDKNGNLVIQSPTLRNDILSGNSADAWYQIRYDSNGGANKPGVAKRRYIESETFGLYNDSGNVTTVEAIAAYQMYTSNRGTMLDYEAKYGEVSDTIKALNTTKTNSKGQPITIINDQIVQANQYSGLQASYPIQVKSLADELACAVPALLDKYVTMALGPININPLNIQFASQGHETLTGENTATETGDNNDLLIADDGNDTLDGRAGNDTLVAGAGNDVLMGGAGSDTYVLSSTNTVTIKDDKDGQGSIWLAGTQLTNVTYKNGTWSDSAGNTYVYDAKLSTMTIDGNIVIDGFNITQAESSTYLGIHIDGRAVALEQGGKKIAANDVYGQPNSAVDPLPGAILITAYVSYVSDQAQTITLNMISGNDGSAFAIDNGGQQLQGLKGGVDLTVAAGQDSVSFWLVNTQDVPKAEAVQLTASCDDGNGGTMTSTLEVDYDATPGYSDAPTPPTNSADNTIIGDRQPINYGTTDNPEYHYDNLGNIITDDIADPGRDDSLFGGSGNNLIQTGDGNNYVNSELGSNDTIEGGNGNDTIFASNGNNSITGGGGQDSIKAGSGNNIVESNDGQDIILLGDGDNRIYGKSKTDITTAINAANSGATNTHGNFIAVGNGDNTIVGGSGNDAIIVGTGNNLIILGSGNSTVDGGEKVVGTVGLNWTSTNSSSGNVDTSSFQNADVESTGGYAATNYEGNSVGGIAVGAGNMTVYGGSGNSKISLGNGENYVHAGSGSNSVYGGNGNDIMFGGNGSGVLSGNGGDDFIEGDAGNYYIFGGLGNNTIYGGTGKDTIVSGDSVVGSGNNYVDAIAGNSLIYGTGGNDTLIAGSGNSTIYGGAGNEFIEGGSGNSQLYSGSGLVAGQGSDTLFAGDGNTTLHGGNNIDYLYGGNGVDVIYGGNGTTEIITGDGGTADNATQVYVNAGVTTVLGGAGYAQIHGGSGQDTLIAGDGYTTITGGSGTEAIFAGAGDALLIAGSGADTLYGGDGASTLQGGSGNTLFVAGSGNTTIQGGSGQNTYEADQGFGSLVITNCQSSDVFRFGAGISVADLSISGGITNDGANALEIDVTTGGSIQIVNGLNGLGTQFSFADGSSYALQDLLQMASVGASDTTGVNGDLQFSSYAGDSLVGGTGNDTLVAFGANTTLTGGAGNTTYIIHDATDVVSEAPNTGNNTVMSTVNYVLPSNVQNLTLLGSDALIATGNDLNNTLTANSGNDVLVAGSGNATLIGGAGNNTFVINNAQDVVVGQVNSGTDTILSAVSYVLPDYVENLTLTGNADLTATGNDLANTLIANDGNDTLVAGSGVATLIGGIGNDTFIVNNSNDVVVKSTMLGTDTILSSVNYVLPDHVENLTLTGSSDLSASGNATGGTITANDGNDTLRGGSGRTTLIGGVGKDTFVLDADTGAATVIDNASVGAVIQLGSGIGFNDVVATQQGNDLLLQVRGAAGNMRLQDYYTGSQPNWTIVDDQGNATTPDVVATTTTQNQTDTLTQLEQDFVTGITRNINRNLQSQGDVLGADGIWHNTYKSTAAGDLNLGNTYVTTNQTDVTTYQWLNGSPDTTTTTSYVVNSDWSNYFEFDISGSASAYNPAYFYVNNDAVTVAQTRIDGSDADISLNDYSFAQTVQTAWTGVNWTSGQSDTSAPWYFSQFGEVYDTNGAITGTYTISSSVSTTDLNYLATFTDPTLSTLVTTPPQSYDNTQPAMVSGSLITTQESYTIQELDLTAGDHVVSADQYSMVIGGTGNNTIYNAGFAYGGIGNATMIGGGTLVAGTGDQYLQDGATMVVGNGRDTVIAGVDAMIQVDPTNTGIDLIGSDIDYTSQFSFTDAIYRALGINNWSVNYTHVGQYFVNYGSDGYVYFDTADEMAQTLAAWQPSTTLQTAIAEGLAGYVQPLPFLVASSVNGLINWEPSSYYAQNAVPVIYANSFAALQPYFDAGILPSTTVAFGAGVTLSDMTLTWGQVVSPQDGVTRVTLNIGWGQDQGIQVIIPTSTDIIGSTVQEFTSADGSRQSLLDMIALAPPAPSFDPDMPFTFLPGMGQQSLGNGYNDIQFSPDINANDITVSHNNNDLVLSYNNGADSLVIANWFSNPQQQPNVIANFADGTLWNAADMTQRGLVMYGVDNTMLQGVNGYTNTLISGVNDTLIGGNLDDTYVFNQGDGIAEIVDIGGNNTLKLGNGITRDMLVLSLGSSTQNYGDATLLLQVGNTGDAVSLNGFDPNNASSFSTIQTITFDDGSTLSMQDLLAQGFTLHGTNADETLSGTSINDQIYAGNGQDTLIGGAGNDVITAGGGTDTFLFNLGDGQDVIVDTVKNNISADTIQFGDGITADMVQFTRQGADLLVSYGYQGDSILIQNIDANGNGNLVINTATYVDGSYSVYQDDGLGNVITNQYDLNGNLTADAWQHSDGSSGEDSFGTDGSYSHTIYNADGTFNSQTNDGLGDTTTLSSDINGNATYAWQNADGSYGQELYYAYGSSVAKSYNADGTYSIYIDDGRGDSTQTDYAADNSASGTVNYADGSYSSFTRDALGNVTSQYFDATGTLTGTGQGTNDGLGNVTTQYYDLTGTLTGTSKGTDDGLGNTYIDYYTTDGTLTRDSWANIEGSYGSDTFNADGSSTGVSYNVDGSYTDTTDNGQGSTSVYNYAADASLINYSWTTNNGQGLTITDTYAADGTLQTDLQISNDGNGNTNDTLTQADGSYQNSWTHADGSYGTAGYVAATGETLGTNFTAGTNYVYGWDVTKLANGSTDTQTSYNYLDGSSYDADTVTSADGSYQQSWQQSSGSYGTAGYVAATGETLGTNFTAGTNYVYGWDVVKLADGSTDTKTSYNYLDGSSYDADTVTSTDGSYQQSWQQSSGSYGTAGYVAATGETLGTNFTAGTNYVYGWDVTKLANGNTDTQTSYNYLDGSSYTADTVTQADGSYQQSWQQSTGSYGTAGYVAATGETMGTNFTAGTNYVYGWDVTKLANGSTDTKTSYNYLDGSSYTADTVTSADGSYQQSWQQSSGSYGTAGYVAATGETMGTNFTTGTNYVYGWDVTKLADGSTDTKTSYNYLDGSSYTADTVTQADGSYQQSWQQSTGSYGTVGYVAATGETLGTNHTAGTDYLYSWDTTLTANGSSDTKTSLNFTSGYNYSTETLQATDNSYQQAWTTSDGTAGSTTVNASGIQTGDSWLHADGTQGVDAGGNQLLIGSANADALVAGNGNALLIGGAGNDQITLGAGNDIVGFDVGGGQDTVIAGSGQNNTLSLGGALTLDELSFSRNGNDLVLGVDAADSVTFKDWYAATGNQSLVTLQVLTAAMPDYAPGSSDVLRNMAVETFDFKQLVAAFDQATAANPTLSAWSLSQELLTAHLSGSDSAMLGGGLAYNYGQNGTLAGSSVLLAQGTISSTQFGTTAQSLQTSSANAGIVSLAA